MRGSSLGLGAASVCLVTALSAKWFWLNLYFRFFPLRELVTSLVIVGVGTAAIAAAFGMLAGYSGRATAFHRFGVLLLLMFLGYHLVRPYFGPRTVGLTVKIVLPILSLAAAAWGGLSLPDSIWRRLAHASSGFGIFVFFSFPLAGLATRGGASQVFASPFIKDQVDVSQNVVLLLLDELSPESTRPITKMMGSKHLQIKTAKLVSDGVDTQDILPAMLTGRHFKYAMPCGGSVMCSERHAVDFSSLYVAGTAVSLVGFFHPYCNVRGLQSCYLAPIASDVPPLRALACTMRAMVFGSACGQAHPVDQAGRMAKVRRQIESGIFSAGFWDSGGILFAHVPLPHPPADETGGSLRVDYEANVAASAELVGRVIDRLKSRFHDRFSLVVMSDHALRVSLYCNGPRYRSPTCADGLPVNAGMVPLIVASPRAIKSVDVRTNAGLLGG